MLHNIPVKYTDEGYCALFESVRVVKYHKDTKGDQVIIFLPHRCGLSNVGTRKVSMKLLPPSQA